MVEAMLNVPEESYKALGGRGHARMDYPKVLEFSATIAIQLWGFMATAHINLINQFWFQPIFDTMRKLQASPLS